MSFQHNSNQGIILGVYNPESYYVDVKTGEPKQKEPMFLSFMGGSINGIPYGATLYIKELDKVIRADELAEIELEKNGTYHVTVKHPHFRTGAVTLTMQEED